MNNKKINLSASKILFLLDYGYANAKPLTELIEESELSGRLVRRCIEVLRLDGYIIINLQNGRGYYLIDPDNIGALEYCDMEKQYRQDRARAISILKRAAPLKRAIDAINKNAERESNKE